MSFLPTPRFVVSEGLAHWARDVAFPGSGQRAWLEEHAFPEAGIEPDGDPDTIQTARDLLWRDSARRPLCSKREGPKKRVVRYLTRWAFTDEEEARRGLPSLQRPFVEAYIFCYHHGRELLEPGMRGPGRDAFVRRLLTEQVSPSELRVAIRLSRERVRGIEPPSPAWKAGALPLSYTRAAASLSGREDLNLRPPAPKAGALPGCATPREKAAA